MKKITMYDIFQAKGKRQLAETVTMSVEEAKAAEDAGIDMLVTFAPVAKAIRQAVPNIFLMVAPSDGKPFDVSNETAISAAYEVFDTGADALYCGTNNLERIAAIASTRLPVFGHVGYIPYRSYWSGGPRAFGKTATEALEIYRRVKAYEAAGAAGLEMELVPTRIAAEISKRTKMCVISMGSGPGCDAQYVFASDLLGTNRGHVPRHAKQYINLAPEYDRLQKLMTESFAQYKQDVTTGAYPEPRHSLQIPEDEFAKFVAGLDK